MNRVRQPFNVNSLALAAALAALDDDAFVTSSRMANASGMRRIVEGVERLGLRYIPSHGNFVCVEIPRQDDAPRAASVFEALLRQGIIVRPLAGYQMPDHLRVTIGLPHENERFLEALAHAMR